MSLTRILYIEDDIDISYTIKSAFELHFNNVAMDLASTLEEVHESITTKHYDIIFYDLCFGYDYPEKIRDMKPGALLIAMSVALLYHDIPKCFDASIFTMQITPRSPSLKMLLKEYGITLK